MTAVMQDGHYTGAVKRSRLVAGITLAETAYAGGLEVASHAHPTLLFVTMLNGAMTELRGRKGVLLSPGTLLVHPAHEPHAHRFHEDGARMFIMQLGTGWAERMAAFGVTRPRSPSDLQRSRANAIIGDIYNEFRTADAASGLGIEGLALALLGELTRAQATAERSATPRWLERAAELLHASAGESVDMAAIAHEVGVHPVHLARSFRERFGSTMGEYLRRLRVERARAQLLSTNAPLTQIALDAGFADQAHFTRVFKKLVGVTPGAYRASAAAGSRV